jgi:hypothetical protein
MHHIAGVLLAVSLLLVGCARGPETAEPRGNETLLDASQEALLNSSQELAARLTNAGSDEHVAMGKLRDVDLDTKTLVVTVDGDDRTFIYDDTTEVHGATGQIQGLVGLDGLFVTVHYESEGDAHRAVRIELP